MKVLIVGGVAAGASAAARLRRLDEQAEIVLLERGAFTSFANCGLPYHIGGVIPARDSLMVMPPEKLAAWFNIDIRTNSNVEAIDRSTQSVTVRKKDGQIYVESYDKLLLAMGSSPLEIPLPGIGDPRIQRLWTIPDMDAILAKLNAGARRVVVVGAGFIGLELAENLQVRGVEVTVVELSDQVLPTIDSEMAVLLEEELVASGIALRLGRKVVAFEKKTDALGVVLDDGEKLSADLVVMSIGVKPNSELARTAGLELGPRGHIVVSDRMQTSDPAIYAAGDVVEVDDPILGGKTAIPLAGPASRQGRIAAENMAGRNARYKGSYGTAVLKVGGLTAGSIGLTERRLKQQKVAYHKIYLHPFSHATYYPGGEYMHLKLIFSPAGKILGAQIIGAAGVDKRIDTLAVAMQSNMTVYGLAELELSYAPPFNSARDPVNFAGMVAVNVLTGDSHIVHADELPADALLVDVRDLGGTELAQIPGSICIPQSQIRARLGELDPQREIVTTCQVGRRGYFAERLLRQHGFKVRNLSGGYATWKLFHPESACDLSGPGRTIHV